MIIDIDRLKMRCTQHEIEFNSLGEVTPGGIFIDNDSKVLAVCHLDYVSSLNFRISKRGDKIYCGSLDDRLGAYIILDLLPKYEILPDVLLTTGEETGSSTAGLFETGKAYNWMFSFDRRGTDVVMYNYEKRPLIDLLYSYKFKSGFGSYSDICYLEGLGVSGFNFGCGYQFEHTLYHHMVIKDTLRQVKRFIPFYNDLYNTRLEHKQLNYRGGYGNYGYYRKPLSLEPKWWNKPYCYMCTDTESPLLPIKIFEVDRLICDYCFQEYYGEYDEEYNV